MTKQEAKRRICAGAAMILDNGGSNDWLSGDYGDVEFSEPDQRRMQEAFEELCAELRRRGEKRV